MLIRRPARLPRPATRRRVLVWLSLVALGGFVLLRSDSSLRPSFGGGSGGGGGGGQAHVTAPLKTVCADTCAHARNGVCDEGRPGPGTQQPPGAIYAVRCDLGTDCADCGPWVHHNTDASDAWRPIEAILAKKARGRGKGPQATLKGQAACPGTSCPVARGACAGGPWRRRASCPLRRQTSPLRPAVAV